LKKRILALLAIVVLLSALVAPMAVLADDTGVTGQVGVAPTVTSCSPNHGDHTQGAIAVTITGTDFIQDTTEADLVTVSGNGVTVGAITVVDTTSITTTFTIDATAAQGARNVLVTVAGVTGTGTGKFTVDLYITVGAPTGIGLGLMTAGATATGSSLDGSVETMQILALPIPKVTPLP